MTYKGKLPRKLLRFCSEEEAAKATDLNSEMAAAHPQNDQTVFTIFISKQIFAPVWATKKSIRHRKLFPSHIEKDDTKIRGLTEAMSVVRSQRGTDSPKSATWLHIFSTSCVRK